LFQRRPCSFPPVGKGCKNRCKPVAGSPLSDAALPSGPQKPDRIPPVDGGVGVPENRPEHQDHGNGGHQ